MSKVEGKPFRVILWSLPRSCSTAISKCFSFIENTQSWFEPFSGLSTVETSFSPMGIALPQNEGEIDGFFQKVEAATKGTPMEALYNKDKMDRSLLLHSTIQEGLNNVPSDRNIFVKDIAHTVTGRYAYLPSKDAGYRHCFLIRHPDRMFPSFRNLMVRTAQMMKMPGLPTDQAGLDALDFVDAIKARVPDVKHGFPYDAQHHLWTHIKENYDHAPVVMDVDEMLANPAEMLPKFFEAAGMPWDEKYLSWDPSPEGALEWRWVFKMEMREDSFGNIHKQAITSSHFLPSKPAIPRDKMTADVIKSSEAAISYYNEMAATRITV